MQQKHLPIFLFVVLCFSSACTHYYYAPNSLQMPFLEKKADTRVGVSGIAGDEFSGWEANAVYSPIQYGAIMLNHFQVRHTQNTLATNENWGKGHLTEFAVGAYYPVKDGPCFSLFGGWGGGAVFNSYDKGATSDLRFHRFFIQPAMALQEDWIRLGVATRFNRLEYTRGDVNLAIDEIELEKIENIENASPVFFSEIGLSIGFGSRPVWVDFKVNINTQKRPKELGFAAYTIAMAFQFELDYLWRKQPDKDKIQ